MENQRMSLKLVDKFHSQNLFFLVDIYDTNNANWWALGWKSIAQLGLHNDLVAKWEIVQNLPPNGIHQTKRLA